MVQGIVKQQPIIIHGMPVKRMRECFITTKAMGMKDKLNGNGSFPTNNARLSVFSR